MFGSFSIFQILHNAPLGEEENLENIFYLAYCLGIL